MFAARSRHEPEHRPLVLERFAEIERERALEPAGVLLGQRAIEAEAMALRGDLRRVEPELRRVVAGRELREEQRAGRDGEHEEQRGEAAAEQEQGHGGLSVFRPFGSQTRAQIRPNSASPGIGLAFRRASRVRLSAR